MTEGYEQRGEYWYERGKPAKNPRLPKSCEGCDTECMMKKLQRFCTADCANKAQFGKTVVSYGSGHDRVRYSRGSASQHPCVDCGQCADEWSYNGGDPDERTGEPGRPGAGFAYSLDPSYYVPRCVSCHRALDSKRGEEHHCAVLTEEKVREIFELYQSTIHLGRLDPDRWSHRKIADLMGVEKTTVGKMLSRKLWAHLDIPELRYEAA